MKSEEFRELEGIILEGFSQLSEQISELSQSKGNKKDLIISKLKIIKNLNIHQIMKFTKCSRPWGIELMKQIANENLGITFILGDKERKIPSLLTYNPARVEYQLKLKIKKILSDGQVWNFANICQILNIDLMIYLSKIRSICSELVNSQEYQMLDSNKIQLIKR